MNRINHLSKVFTLLFTIITALGLAGCVAPVKMTEPFDESAFRWSVGKGNAAVVGSAFMKTQGGDVKYGAGDEVELIPATRYTKERFEAVKQMGMYQRMEQRDPRLADYVRRTIADAQGNFEFRSIPSGEYILSCMIQWQYPTQYGLQTTGGQAIEIVLVSDNEVKKVVLTK